MTGISLSFPEAELRTLPGTGLGPQRKPSHPGVRVLGRAPNPGVKSKAWTLLSLWPAKPLPCWEPLHQTCPCPDRRLAPEEGAGPSWASFSGGPLTLPKSSGVLAGKAPQRGPLQDLVLSPTLGANIPQSYRLRQMDTWRAWGFPAGWLPRPTPGQV